MFFFLPYGNDRKTTRFPAVTYFLIAVNVGIYLWLLQIDKDLLLQQFGLIPNELGIGSIITSMFVHASVMHLLWNMLFLWLFGPNVEDALGHFEYGIFYIASGFAAAMMHVVVVENFMPSAASVPVVGASGAIAGILGIFAIRFFKTRIKIFWYLGILLYPIRWGTFSVSAMVGLSIWFFQQIAGGVISVAEPLYGDTARGLFNFLQRIGFGEGVAYWSHIGGMVFGMALAYVLKLATEGTKEYLMRDAKENMEKGTAYEAIRNLQAFLERDPDNVEAHAKLARTYAMQSDEESATAHYQRSIKLSLTRCNYDDAVAYFAEFKHFFRNGRIDLKSQFQIAKHLIKSGFYEPAIDLLLSIAGAFPGTPEAEVSLIKAGDMYSKKFENWREAARCYELFVEQYPQSQWITKVKQSLAEMKKHS